MERAVKEFTAAGLDGDVTTTVAMPSDNTEKLIKGIQDKLMGEVGF